MAQNGITRRQSRAIIALLDPSNGTLGDAATAAKVGYRTLCRWVQEDPHFQHALRQAEADAIEDASRQLVGLQAHAVAVLHDILTDDEAPASVRLKAANSVLDWVLRLRELVSFEQRIARLEAHREAQH